MLENISVVVKRNKDWLLGNIEDNREFNIIKKIKKLADVKEVSEYKTLKTYLKLKNIKEKEEDILNEFNVDKIDVLDKNLKVTENSFEKVWWETLNKKCLGCKKSCKQSEYTDIIKCKSYIKE